MQRSFPLHAERCLSYASEQPGDAWPDWVPPTAHNCLIGCLRCQEVCPRNRGLLRFLEAEPVFDTADTLKLLGPDEDVPESMAEKLKELGVASKEGVALIRRGLRALVGAQELRGVTA